MVYPLAKLLLIVATLVHEDLSVVREDDPRALERTRRWPFEVDAADVIAAAVARTLELVLRREIVRRAPEVRAHGDEGVEPGRVHGVVVGRAHDPDRELLLPPLVHAHAVLVRESGLELLRRLVQ